MGGQATAARPSVIKRSSWVISSAERPNLSAWETPPALQRCYEGREAPWQAIVPTRNFSSRIMLREVACQHVGRARSTRVQQPISRSPRYSVGPGAWPAVGSSSPPPSRSYGTHNRPARLRRACRQRLALVLSKSPGGPDQYRSHADGDSIGMDTRPYTGLPLCIKGSLLPPLVLTSLTLS